MKKTLLWNGTVVVNGFTSIEQGGLLMEDDKIKLVLTQKEVQQWIKNPDVLAYDVKHQYIMPGLIDIHIHGAEGNDFIEGGQSVVDVVARNLVKDGCTGFMASLTVLQYKKLLKVLKSYATIHDLEKGAHFLGVHAEGPYLSREFKALMNEMYLSDPSIEQLDEMMQCANNKLKIMTIAPEREGMMEFIRYGTKRGVRMMIGHSAATSAIATQALHAGAIGFTHLYNAMSQHLHREPGVVTSAFINKDAYVELIVDGLHVDPEVVLMTYLNKKASSIILITDAMLGKGMPNGEYTFSDLICVKENMSITTKENGRRAGSVVSMDYVLRTMANITGCSVNELVQMACVNPSVVAGVDDTKGTLEVGKDADVCIMNENYENQMTFVSGRLAYTKG